MTRDEAIEKAFEARSNAAMLAAQSASHDEVMQQAYAAFHSTLAASGYAVVPREVTANAATAIEMLLRERDALLSSAQKCSEKLAVMFAERDAAIKERDELRDCNYELQNVTEKICLDKIVKERDAAIARAEKAELQVTEYELARDAVLCDLGRDLNAANALCEGERRRADANLELAQGFEDEARALRALLREARGALMFYADPWERTDIHGDDVRVPEFYDEMNFGETAEQTLSRIDAALKGGESE